MGYSAAAWERAMRMQDVILRAISGEIQWFRSGSRGAGIAGAESPGHVSVSCCTWMAVRTRGWRSDPTGAGRSSRSSMMPPRRCSMRSSGRKKRPAPS